MRVVLQRVSSARVEVEGAVVGDLGGPGLVALVGVTHGEGPTQVDWMARKIAGLRIFDGADGDETPGAERSVAEAGLPVLVVSQFTLYADVRKGRRPSWSAAAPGSVAEPLVDALAAALRAQGLTVASGTFGAHMMVHLVNDGPVTLVLDV
ncbi:MAG: D-aminoacyl-tRNA deacylase [Candidatus Phosphoribacter baldrii]|jgi:D-tyrosyl-tRNA(Tyr) deacylase|nr:D-aminoacyl-tRNA deacylase [Dermatophilaceae bacterium]